MSERYVVQERQGYDWYGVVVDSTDGRELCEADCCSTPEDASVERHFAPLLSELNALATRLAAAESEVERLRVHVDFWQERVGEVRAEAERAERERDEERRQRGMLGEALHKVALDAGVFDDESPVSALDPLNVASHLGDVIRDSRSAHRFAQDRAVEIARALDAARAEATRLRSLLLDAMSSHSEEVAQSRLALIGQTVRERDTARRWARLWHRLARKLQRDIDWMNATAWGGP